MPVSPNKIKVGTRYCRMELYRKGKVIAKTVFDKRFLPLIEGRRWRIDGRGYVGNTFISMHRLFVPKKIGMEIDHINRDKLDNRLFNLRLVSRAQNNWNKKSRGFYRHPQTGRWTVQIRVNGRHLHIGCFKTVREAKEARKLAKNKYHKYA